MHTPATAILWELWRLTRRDLAFKLPMIIVIGSMALVLAGWGGWQDKMALLVLILYAIFSTTSAINQNRKMVDDRRGFPFYLGFARPVPTWLLVGGPMAFLGIHCALSYLIPMTVLRVIFDIPFPLVSFAAAIAAVALACAAARWWTSDKVIQFGGSLAVSGGLISVVLYFEFENVLGNDLPLERWPEIFGFTLTHYGVIALVAAAAIGLTFVGVKRQRHGDSFSFRNYWSGARRSSPAAGGSYSIVAGWLKDRFQMPCPTSSATRAQLWFEMKSVGWEVLSSGVVMALVVPLFLVFEIAVEWTAPIFLVMLSPAVPMFVGLRRILGVRLKQGSKRMSLFDATRALGTARLIGVKVLVTVACILCAWMMIGASFWATLSLFSDEADASIWVSLSLNYIDVADVGTITNEIAETLSDQPGYRLAGWVALAVIQLSVLVAFFATLQAFLVLSATRVMLVIVGFVLCTLAYMLAVEVESVAHLFFLYVGANAWIVAVAISVGTLYAFREALADRILTSRNVGVAVAMWAGYTATIWALLRDWEMMSSELPWAIIALLISLTLMPLGAVALAPWSLGLIRHR